MPIIEADDESQIIIGDYKQVPEFQSLSIVRQIDYYTVRVFDNFKLDMAGGGRWS